MCTFEIIIGCWLILEVPPMEVNLLFLNYRDSEAIRCNLFGKTCILVTRITIFLARKSVGSKV